MLVIKYTTLTHRPRARHSITALHSQMQSTHSHVLVHCWLARQRRTHLCASRFSCISTVAWHRVHGKHEAEYVRCVCVPHSFEKKYALNRRYKVSFSIRTVVILCVLIKAFGSIRNESKRAIENFVPWKIEIETCVPVQMLSATSETSVQVVSAQNHRIFSAKECLIFLI